MFDPTQSGGGGGYPRCCCCNLLILHKDRSVWIDFATDPDGLEGLTGHYHERCSKPFISIARAINVCSFNRF